MRGGIVDVFPSTRRSPVRVEWWGDEIESVRAVSLATQRVVRELEAVTVYAAREGDLAAWPPRTRTSPRRPAGACASPAWTVSCSTSTPSRRGGCCPRRRGLARGAAGRRPGRPRGSWSRELYDHGIAGARRRIFTGRGGGGCRLPRRSWPSPTP